MVKIGITGIFGSGKSAVSRIFKKHGIKSVSCDNIVEGLLKTRFVREEIRNNFGGEFFVSGGINKKKLADVIFSSKTKRELLNGIIHPLVFERLKKLFDKFSKKYKIIAIEIPLLFETDSSRNFDV